MVELDEVSEAIGELRGDIKNVYNTVKGTNKRLDKMNGNVLAHQKKNRKT